MSFCGFSLGCAIDDVQLSALIDFLGALGDGSLLSPGILFFERQNLGIIAVISPVNEGSRVK